MTRKARQTSGQQARRAIAGPAADHRRNRNAAATMVKTGSSRTACRCQERAGPTSDNVSSRIHSTGRICRLMGAVAVIRLRRLMPQAGTLLPFLSKLAGSSHCSNAARQPAIPLRGSRTRPCRDCALRDRLTEHPFEGEAEPGRRTLRAFVQIVSFPLVTAIAPIVESLAHHQEHRLGGRPALLKRGRVVDMPDLDHTLHGIDPQVARHAGRPAG